MTYGQGDSVQNGGGDGSTGALGQRTMLVLYGSETGNSEEVAGEVDSMARRLHFEVDLEEMNQVKLGSLLRYTLVVFVISTTGRGDIPRNAREFWKHLLRKRLPADCLSRVRFTTFGLGDSSYTQYNWAARKLHKRLEQLGAVDFLPRGEADERHEDGVDGTFIPWCLTLRSYLEEHHPLSAGRLPIPDDALLQSRFTLELLEPTSAMSTLEKGNEAATSSSEGEARDTPNMSDSEQSLINSEKTQDKGTQTISTGVYQERGTQTRSTFEQTSESRGQAQNDSAHIVPSTKPASEPVTGYGGLQNKDNDNPSIAQATELTAIPASNSGERPDHSTQTVPTTEPFTISTSISSESRTKRTALELMIEDILSRTHAKPLPTRTATAKDSGTSPPFTSEQAPPALTSSDHRNSNPSMSASDQPSVVVTGFGTDDSAGTQLTPNQASMAATSSSEGHGTPATPTTEQAANAGLGTTNGRARRPSQEIDNHGRVLDAEAAAFSHVDVSPQTNERLKFEHRVEDRMSALGNIFGVRESEGSAQDVPGGIDKFDKLNVLKDSAGKYSLEDNVVTHEFPATSVLPIPGSFVGVVEENVRVTPDSHWQDVRHITIKCDHKRNSEGTPFNWKKPPTYLPGDLAVIYPKNFDKDVQALIDLMGWNDDADKRWRHIYNAARGTDVLPLTPRGCYVFDHTTLRDLLTHNYDITSIPRRSFFHHIHHYTNDPAHKERLWEFGDSRFSEEFWDYTSRPRRSILEVLQDFPSVKIPPTQIPAIFPLIRGREYSIASGGDMMIGDSGHVYVELLIALVKYKTVLKKTREGLTSRYVSALPRGCPIAIQIRDNAIPELFRDPTRDLVIIAPGTGLAPMRGLIQDRAARRHRQNRTGQTILFYGGRNRGADFFFEEEFDEVGVHVIPAFSRDQPQKIYVQHRIREKASLICDMIRKDAGFCLCGSSGKMPEAVKEAIIDAMVVGMLCPNHEAAKAKWAGMRHLFWEEVW